MNDPTAQGARAAARRLTAPAHPTLADDVEIALHTREHMPEPTQFTDPTALGGLIVSIANLAWLVYADLRSRGPAPAPATDVVARRVRVRIEASQLDPAELDRIVDITVEEIFNAAEAQAEGEAQGEDS